MTKMTAEAKARNAAIRAEREVRETEMRARASLDSCEGIGFTEREMEQREAIYQTAMRVKDLRQSRINATERIARAAAETAARAVADEGAFYDGRWFAAQGADLAEIEAQYKAALETRALLERALPGVPPMFSLD